MMMLLGILHRLQGMMLLGILRMGLRRFHGMLLLGLLRLLLRRLHGMMPRR